MLKKMYYKYFEWSFNKIIKLMTKKHGLAIVWSIIIVLDILTLIGVVALIKYLL